LILKLLNQGLYPQQISQKTSLSLEKISRILNWLESKKYITLTSKYPRLYKVGQKTKLYILYLEKLLKGPKSKKKISGTKNKIRIHKIGYKNKLIRAPNWLWGLPENQNTKYNGINVYRNSKTKNNEQFYIYLDYTKFNGLTSIKITTQKVIYYFDRLEEHQWIPFTMGAYNNYCKELEHNCIRARNYLEKDLEFKIDRGSPLLLTYPECALSLNGKSFFGTTINGSLELKDGRKIYFDDSPGRMEGEIEGPMDVMNNVFNVIPEKVNKIEKDIGNLKNIPEKLDKLNDSIKEMPESISREISKNLNQFKTEFTREITTQMSEAVGTSVSTALKEAFSQLNSNQNNKTGGNMFT